MDATRNAALDAAAGVLRSATEPPARPVVVEVSSGGVVVRVTVRAEGPGEALTPCERDVLWALAGAPMPLTTRRILAKMEAAGRLHGESTVKAALARMAADGRVVSRARAPRGYVLPAA